VSAEHDDHLADALALIQAVREHDAAGLRALLANMDGAMTALRLAELFAAVMNEHDVSPEEFRRWAARTVKS
jgi:predicted benzoate:H+ symporter BenE